jgi:SAM-dependent methyltransferase
MYESPDHLSITTMNKLIDGKTQVYFCHHCGHLQTNKLENLEQFYAEEYETNLYSEDDDQLYKVIDGIPVYRADHQAKVLLSKVPMPSGAKVLDYGCAKAPTLKKIVEQKPEIEPYLFDVTNKYVKFWDAFPKSAHYSVFEPDATWYKNLDIVLSFYALEHVAELDKAISNITKLLKPGGIFYFIVPNVYANIADFIVADHINHFSKSSLEKMLSLAGFGEIDIDNQVHDAAFVVTAKLTTPDIPEHKNNIDKNDIESCYLANLEMAKYWDNLKQKINIFEEQNIQQQSIAIYGAGFYGNFIASLLKYPDRVECFVDQNEFLQNEMINNKPILSPEQLSDDISYVLVGLNPIHARESIQSIESWRERDLKLFFL